MKHARLSGPMPPLPVKPRRSVSSCVRQLPHRRSSTPVTEARGTPPAPDATIAAFMAYAKTERSRKSESTLTAPCRYSSFAHAFALAIIQAPTTRKSGPRSVRRRSEHHGLLGVGGSRESSSAAARAITLDESTAAPDPVPPDPVSGVGLMATISHATGTAASSRARRQHGGQLVGREGADAREMSRRFA